MYREPLPRWSMRFFALSLVALSLTVSTASSSNGLVIRDIQTDVNGVQECTIEIVDGSDGAKKLVSSCDMSLPSALAQSSGKPVGTVQAQLDSLAGAVAAMKIDIDALKEQVATNAENHDIEHNTCRADANVCGEHGTCVDGVRGAYLCQCEDGWQGLHCGQKEACEEGYCSGHGTVSGNKVDGCTCACEQNFIGNTCNEMAACDAGYCNGNGVVNGNKVQGCTCACTHGWTGNRCAASVNDCVGNPCNNGAQCVDAHLDYTCTCPAHTYGKDCEAKSSCDGNYCSGHGVVSGNKFDGCSCSCHQHYTGNRCETHSPPSPSLSPAARCGQLGGTTTSCGDWSAYDSRYPNLEYCCLYSSFNLYERRDGVYHMELMRSSGWGWHGSLPAGTFGSGAKGDCMMAFSRSVPNCVAPAPTPAPTPTPPTSDMCAELGGHTTRRSDWSAYDSRYANLQYCCFYSGFNLFTRKNGVYHMNLMQSAGWSWHGSLPAGTFGSGSKGDCLMAFSR